MTIVPFLRAQNQLLSDIRIRMRDPNGDRWTDTEIYTGINDCLLTWQNRVTIPHLYTIPGGWSTGTSDYTLPSYIRGTIDPQQKRYSSHWLHVSGMSSDADTWVDMQGFTLEPNGSGGMTLRLDFSPVADDGRVIWWHHNGSVPTTIPTTNAGIDADDTTLVIGSSIFDIEQSGYIKVGSEWMHYAGVDYGTSTTTLSNLLRGLGDTTATTHNSGSSVYWGVGAHRSDLYNQLYSYVRGFLHALYLTNGAETEKSTHERMALYWNGEAEKYWRRYVPNRKPKVRLGREVVGLIGDESTSQYYNRAWGTRL